MECLHPFCPMRESVGNWESVVDDIRLNVDASEKVNLLSLLSGMGNHFCVLHQNPTNNSALLKRLLDLCPCLYSQLDKKVSASGVVHLCEITLLARIISSNVCDAFDVQHPDRTNFLYIFPPLKPGAPGGDIMEALCSEVLTNEGIPHMVIDSVGWPEWKAPAHVSLNRGKFSRIKLYGDILIPAAPTNMLISVKSEKARERLVVSGNRFESIGFGFFDQPSEFWTENRIRLYKRMGFTAIYMPNSTLQQITECLRERNMSDIAININGTALYRDIASFGSDMRRIAGKVTLDL